LFSGRWKIALYIWMGNVSSEIVALELGCEAKFPAIDKKLMCASS
jgi:hypothetical protein